MTLQVAINLSQRREGGTNGAIAGQRQVKNNTGIYQALRDTRQQLRAKRRLLIPQENELRQLRKEQYYWNKIDRAAGSSQTSTPGRAAPAANTAPTWNRPQAEDRTLNLDISAFIQQNNVDSNNNDRAADTERD
ncbi:hypothetical protein BGZ65_003950 [Modicella reniformis]|uniref:Uncharacterized protein n=1 Tax=Modicella reniformis TaxID=1440133 RepID=A0A9P6IZ67_9FUNG|nr:hypothetical protein BGZ65_003950 [Modicella reniformis]